MLTQSNLIRIRRKTVVYFIASLVALAAVTPALAAYLGPKRTVLETTSICKIILKECQYVTAKGDYLYHKVDGWSCSNESKPWRDYSSQPSSQGCFAGTNGDQYWERDEILQEVTNTYPPATINGSLQNCTLQNGWCSTPSTLLLSGSEPVLGHSILAIEGSRNGETFACSGSSCNVPLNEGANNFTYWALSSWGDSSTMGTVTAKVDSQLPNITGTFTGTLGLNGWYIAPASWMGTASDATSGLASFTCSMDGVTLPSCSSIAVNSQGAHTIVLTARDNAGNARVLTQTTSLDTQNPLLTASLGGTMGSNDWYTAAALNASASDAMPGSGLSAFEYNLDNTGWKTFPGSSNVDLPEGRHNVDIRAMDNAGRTVSTSKSFWLDAVVPGVELSPTGTLGSNDWHNTDLTLSASASDNTSGIDIFDYSLNNSAWTNYTTPLTLPDGTHSISFWAQDQAGLVNQVDRTFKVDTHPPEISGSLSGVLGTNGWYTSNVTLSAFASDPTPGSGLEVFTFILNDNTETPYTDPLMLLDGEHLIQLNAQDKASLHYAIEQIVKVDTVAPSLDVQTTLPNWIKSSVALNGISSDSGSGLSTVEISTDGGQTWYPSIDSSTWNYIWNTADSSNGIHNVHVRATDVAGLTTEQIVNVGVDNDAPKISLPGFWYQWDTVILDVWDHNSGLSEVLVEISDAEERWPKRVIQLDPEQFPLSFKWDRHFDGDTIAPPGTYDVQVIALDNVGNSTSESASLTILLDILPPGPTATLQPTSRSQPTPTLIYTATSAPSAVATQTVMVSVFGATPRPETQATSIPEAVSTPRSTPSQNRVTNGLESIFGLNTTEEKVTEIRLLDESKAVPDATAGRNPSVLWGAAAAAMAGAVTAYALEEKRKQQEEKARQAAAEAEAEERREKMQARQIEKMDAKRAQEQAWEEARAQKDFATGDMTTKFDRDDAEADAIWVASQAEIQKRYEDKQRAEEEKKKAEELKAGLAAYYNGRKQGDETPAVTQSNWWEKTKSFVSENIFEPLNTYVYQPLIAPVLKQTADSAAAGASWVDKNIYQPVVERALERTKDFVRNEATWINEKIYQPHVKPAIENSKQFLINETVWVNQSLYQPSIKPAVERTKQFIINESVWINEKLYQPFIQPAVEKTKQFVINESTWIEEELYEPYMKPFVDKSMEFVANEASWINKNIYQPFLAPVVDDINQYIYQPYIKPLGEKASDWWEKYGEWVHGALDTVGFIPGLGEIADGLNGLIYLREGRYLEASISAIAMIPVLGDLGKAGKWGLQVGAEIVEGAAEKIVKEVTAELIEDAVREALEEVAEQVIQETSEEIVEKTVKESLEEVVEKTLQETGNELADRVVRESFEIGIEREIKETAQELVGHTVMDGADNAVTEVVKDPIQIPPEIAMKNISNTAVEKAAKETFEQVSEETAQFISSLTETYGKDMVEKFLPFCEKYDINPYEVLTRPPAEGQSLIGWGLDIDNPGNPVNHPLVQLNLTQDELNNILNKSVERPYSKIVVLGYGGGSAKPYYVLSDEIEGCHLSLSAETWKPFENARANFWVDINTPFIEEAIADRKIFLFNVESDVITNPRNGERFSLPELRLIEMEKNNYVQVPVGEYSAFVPVELLDTYKQHLPMDRLSRLGGS